MGSNIRVLFQMLFSFVSLCATLHVNKTKNSIRPTKRSFLRGLSLGCDKKLLFFCGLGVYFLLFSSIFSPNKHRTSLWQILIVFTTSLTLDSDGCRLVVKFNANLSEISNSQPSSYANLFARNMSVGHSCELQLKTFMTEIRR